MSANIQIKNLTECDIDAAADICAQALVNSPSYVDIYRGGGDENWRLGELKWLFATHFKVIHAKEPSALKGGYDQNLLVCFFMFVPSTMPPISLWDKLWAGFLVLPFRVGWQIYSQLVTTAEHFDNIYKELIPDRECIEVLRMVVSPNWQGKGIGSKCLAAALVDADRLKKPVRLSTQLEINVSFYSKHGFRVVRETDYTCSDSATDSYHNWFLVREPLEN